MLTFKKILCPTDFSRPSYEAIEEANSLALQFSAEVILLHVVSPIHAIPTANPPVGLYVPSYVEDMGALAQKKLHDVVQKEISPGVKTRTIVAYGSPAEEIARIAADEHIDVIVIATHGLTGWRHLVFGSVAEKVVRLAPCTVLITQAPTKEREQTHRDMVEDDMEESKANVYN